MSAPCAIGRVNTGVATVESTQRMALASCAISDTAAMSVTVHNGLLGVSIQNRPVSPGPYRGAHRVEVGRLDEGDAVAVTADLLQPGAEAPIHHPRGDDMGRLFQREKDRRRRRHAGGEGHRLGRAFQRRHQCLDLLHRGVVGAAVDVAAAIAVVGVAQVGRRHVDGGDQRLGDGVAGAHRLRQQGPRFQRQSRLIVHSCSPLATTENAGIRSNTKRRWR